MADRDLRRKMKEHMNEEIHGSKIAPYIQDVVYGGNDGIVTTFAVVAGTMGADLPHYVVVILGLANLIADGTSMGTGSFLSTKSEMDNYKRLRKEELNEIKTDPELEKEEIRYFYEKKGFQGQDLERVTQVITSNDDVWADTMMLEEHGLTEDSASQPLLHGMITFASFIAFGVIPLLPYLLGISKDARFDVAIWSTFASLALLGFTRSWVTKERLLRGPIEIIVIGAIGAFVAYGIGNLLEGVTTMARFI